ncbi:MAG: hypothetical protein SVV80_06970 [Planctomycetota bacterium]|nr:hypothetical protein [Planctomycetota bacterium]
MKVPAWTYWAAIGLAAAAGASGQSPARPVDPASGPASRPASTDFGEFSRAAEEIKIPPPSDPTEVPITLPTVIQASGKQRAMLPSGVMIIDRVASIENDPAGQWHTIKDQRVGVLYLLPCELLEDVEKTHAENPEAEFNLSGEVHRYRGGYYMLLHRALLMPRLPSSAPAATTQPVTTQPATTSAATTKPVEPPVVSHTEPTSQPAQSRSAKASAEDVAAELLGETPARPIVPVVKPKLPEAVPAPSGAPSGQPLHAGPGKNAVHRLVRLMPKEEGRKWARIAFEADNTLREPPMRALPNLYLEKMEALSNEGTAFGAVFHISGEVHRYKGKDYILLRAVIKKRNLGQF